MPDLNAPMKVALLFLCHLTLCLRVGAYPTQTQDDDIPPEAPRPFDEALDNGTYGYFAVDNYVTAPDIPSPKTNWLQWSPECNDGLYYFITPRGWGIERPGPMILDWKGDLVWTEHFGNEFGGQAYDLMVQRYQGQDFLTFWTGDDRVRGHGAGSYVMLNSSYDVVHKIDAGNGLAADLHEFLITSEGTALLTIYQKYEHDGLSAFRSFNATEDPADAEAGWIWDSVFQELAVDTREVIFEWRASEHVDIEDTYHNVWHTGNHEDPFDWYHINSIQKDELGNYLISARYTHSVTYINGRTGDILWTMGGKSNDFMDLSDGLALNFAWQHDARFVPLDSFPDSYTPPKAQEGVTTQLLTMFDNAAEDQNYEYGMEMSRGLLLEIRYPTPISGDERDADRQERARRSELEEGDNLPADQRKLLEINGTDSAYTVRVIKSYENPTHIRSSSQGSMQLLPQSSGRDPKVFVGYGLNAAWTEFASDGSVLCDVHFGATTSWERGDIQSYRSYKFPWSAWPRHNPKITVSDDDMEIFASWNGATEVVEWALQASNWGDEDDESGWTEIARKARVGFETAFHLPDTKVGVKRYLRAVAISSRGKVLANGASKVLDRGYLASYFPGMSKTISDEAEHPNPIQIFWLAVALMAVGILGYEGYRRYLSWKLGGQAAGALRWRKGSGYRLLIGDP